MKDNEIDDIRDMLSVNLDCFIMVGFDDLGDAVIISSHNSMFQEHGLRKLIEDTVDPICIDQIFPSTGTAGDMDYEWEDDDDDDDEEEGFDTQE